MANEHLGALPVGLTGEDFSPTGDSLLDYTPPNVQWQAPLAQTGSNVFANYVKSYPDLLRTYNRRLSRPESSFEALPYKSGVPQSMGAWGEAHYKNYGQAAGRELYNPLGLWSDAGRSPYIGYGGLPGMFEPSAGTSSVSTAAGEEPEVTTQQVIDWSDTDTSTTEETSQGGQTPQQIVEQAIEDDPSLAIHPNIYTGQGIPTETAYPSGHNTHAGWYMDPTNQFGHYWALGGNYTWDFGLGRYKLNGIPVY